LYHRDGKEAKLVYKMYFLADEHKGLVTAVLICWAIMPIAARTVGRWHIWADRQKNAVVIRNLSLLVPVSILVLAIVFGITYCVVRFVFRVLVR